MKREEIEQKAKLRAKRYIIRYNIDKENMPQSKEDFIHWLKVLVHCEMKNIKKEKV